MYSQMQGQMSSMEEEIKDQAGTIETLERQLVQAGIKGKIMQAEMEVEKGWTPRFSPLADVRDLGGLLQRTGFALPVADFETITVYVVILYIYVCMLDYFIFPRTFGAGQRLEVQDFHVWTVLN